MKADKHIRDLRTNKNRLGRHTGNHDGRADLLERLICDEMKCYEAKKKNFTSIPNFET